MMAGFGLHLILPALVLVFVGWLVPRLLFHVFPEGIKPLILLAVCSTVVMFGFGITFFGVLYLAQGIPWAMLSGDGWVGFVAHFLRLGAVSALLWGPIMALSVASLPRRWKREVG